MQHNGSESNNGSERYELDVMLAVNCRAYSFEAGNVRHEHEWKVWRDVRLPDGQDPAAGRGEPRHQRGGASRAGGGPHRALRPARGRPGAGHRRDRLRPRRDACTREIAWAKLESLARGRGPGLAPAPWRMPDDHQPERQGHPLPRAARGAGRIRDRQPVGRRLGAHPRRARLPGAGDLERRVGRHARPARRQGDARRGAGALRAPSSRRPIYRCPPTWRRASAMRRGRVAETIRLRRRGRTRRRLDRGRDRRQGQAALRSRPRDRARGGGGAGGAGAAVRRSR